ncbi:hypothetical protein [Candidatus Stoquefichus massiliensis]|uniref:hypothetical protein n=1 Tax=Candidatus Stoquefichus massiliensis TaxID=1470350 RepID=UPI00047F4864|nr:hypothetical protein [Candidatus Stoquefichus massiliensis]
MNREQLQSYIYTEKLLAQLYRQAAARATLQDERQVLLSFAQNAEQNANYLNYFYRMEFGTGFDPMIPEGNIQGTYRDLLNEIQKQELSSYLELRKLTYNQGDTELRETIRAITDNKLAHILTILAIVTNMNTPESEGN